MNTLLVIILVIIFPIFTWGASYRFTSPHLLKAKNLRVDSAATPFLIDWDKDGDLDLISGSKEGYVYLFLNIGTRENPRFANPAYIYDTKGTPLKHPFNTSVIAIDWNQDNKFDLLIGDGEGKVYVWKNVGTEDAPSFLDKEAIMCSSGEVKVAGNASIWVTDYNSDSKKDLLVGDSLGYVYYLENIKTDKEPFFNTPKRVLIYPQIGTPTAGATPTFGVELNVGKSAAPLMVDYDNDFDKDLIVGDGYGYLNIFFNFGTPTNPLFSAPFVGTPTATPTTTLMPRIQYKGRDLDVGNDAKPIIVDWDNDSRKDILIGEARGYFYIYLNAGRDEEPIFDRYYILQQGEGEELFVGRHSAVDVVDYNGDYKKDLLIGDEYGYIWVALNYAELGAPPSFGAVSKLTLANGEEIDVGYNATPRLLDYNNDGKKDLIVGNKFGKITLFLNYGDDEIPSFATSTYIKLDEEDLDVGYNSVPEVIDYNSDGRKDLLVGAADGKLYLFLNEGTDNSPAFSSVTILKDRDGKELKVVSNSAPTADDLNQDGKFDIIVGDSHGNLHLYLNVGELKEPTFIDCGKLISEGKEIDFGAYSIPILRDYNHDSFLDIISGTEEGKLFISYGNIVNSPAHLTIAPIYGTQSGKIELKFSLIDEDYDTCQVIVEYSLDSGISWQKAFIINDSTYLFASPEGIEHVLVWDSLTDLGRRKTYVTLRITPYDPAVGYSSEINLFVNNTYLPRYLTLEAEGKHIDVGGYANPLLWDYNGDGRIDLLAGEENGGILLFLNQGSSGNPKWASPRKIYADDSELKVRSFAAPWSIDYNNDGKKDLLVGDGYGQLTLFLNEARSPEPKFIKGQLLLDVNNNPIDVGEHAAPLMLDYDHDNRKDLLLGNREGEVFFYPNINSDGAPKFDSNKRELIAKVPLGYAVPEIVDWNNNGKEDLLVSNYEGNLYLFINYADTLKPKYAPSKLLKYEGEALDFGRRVALKLSDYDADSKIDDAILGNQEGNLLLFLDLVDLTNSAPCIEITPPSGLLRGKIKFSFNLYDDEGDTLDFLFLWRKSGEALWQQGTSTYLVASPLGETHYFVWDSEKALGNLETTVEFKLIADDKREKVEKEFSLFVDNLNAPPNIKDISFETTPAYLKLNYDLEEPEGEECTLQIEYAHKNLDWTPATIIGKRENLLPGKKSIIWLQSKDLPDFKGEINLRLIVKDPWDASSTYTLSLQLDTKDYYADYITKGESKELIFPGVSIIAKPLAYSAVFVFNKNPSVPPLPQTPQGMQETLCKLSAFKVEESLIPITNINLSLIFPFPQLLSSELERNLRVFSYQGGKWAPLEVPQRVNVENNTITAEVSSLGVYMIGLYYPKEEPISLPFPNPWIAGYDVENNPAPQGITFILPVGAKIEIYNLNRELIASYVNESNASSSWIWRVSEEKVASGLYFYLISNNGKKNEGKVVVIK